MSIIAPPEIACKKYMVSDVKSDDLHRFRRELIAAKNDALLNDDMFEGIVIDQDAIRPFYKAGQVETFSVKRLQKMCSFIYDWSHNIIPRARATFSTIPNFDLASIALSSVKQNILFQVISQPRFEQGDYEDMDNRHPTCSAFIPSAAYALRVSELAAHHQTRDIIDNSPKDWAYPLAYNARIKSSIRLNNQDLNNGTLDKVIKEFLTTQNIHVWSNIGISHQRSSDGKQLFKAPSSAKTTLDLFFTPDLILSENCDASVIKDNREKLIEFARVQYSAILDYSLSKVHSPQTIYLSPLHSFENTDLPQTIISRLSCEALVSVLGNIQRMAWGPAINVVWGSEIDEDCLRQIEKDQIFNIDENIDMIKY